VRGGDECEAGSRRQRGRNEAGVIHGDGDELSASDAECLTGALVAGIFNANRIAAFEQHASDKIEGLLRSVDDNDLVGIAVNSAGAAHMRANEFAKLRIAFRLSVVEFGDSGAPGTA